MTKMVMATAKEAREAAKMALQTAKETNRAREKEAHGRWSISTPSKTTEAGRGTNRE
jgi:hypothetical protein